MQSIQQHIKKHLFQVAPVFGTADDRKEDDEKEDGVDVTKKDDAEGKGEDALDEVASEAASVGQRLSGGYLALKLQALLQDCASSEAGLATLGLRVFEDLMLGEGAHGTVCQAEYRGEDAAAKVFTFTGRRRKQKTAARGGE